MNEQAYVDRCLTVADETFLAAGLPDELCSFTTIREYIRLSMGLGLWAGSKWGVKEHTILPLTAPTLREES